MSALSEVLSSLVPLLEQSSESGFDNIYTLKNSPFLFLFVSIFPLAEGIE